MLESRRKVEVVKHTVKPFQSVECGGAKDVCSWRCCHQPKRPTQWALLPKDRGVDGAGCMHVDWSIENGFLGQLYRTEEGKGESTFWRVISMYRVESPFAAKLWSCLEYCIALIAWKRRQMIHSSIAACTKRIEDQRHGAGTVMKWSQFLGVGFQR